MGNIPEEIRSQLILNIQDKVNHNYTLTEININPQCFRFSFLEDAPYKVDKISTRVFPKRISLNLYSERKVMINTGDKNYFALYDWCDEHEVIYFALIQLASVQF